MISLEWRWPILSIIHIVHSTKYYCILGVLLNSTLLSVIFTSPKLMKAPPKFAELLMKTVSFPLIVLLLKWDAKTPPPELAVLLFKWFLRVPEICIDKPPPLFSSWLPVKLLWPLIVPSNNYADATDFVSNKVASKSVVSIQTCLWRIYSTTRT